MEAINRDDPALDAVAGGLDAYNANAVTAALENYNANNPTQGVTNFQHPSTVYNTGVTESTAWIPSADLYVIEDYDASNGKPVMVEFDFNGNGYDPNNIGGSLVDKSLTEYGSELANEALQDGQVDVVQDPGSWFEGYLAGGGTGKTVD